ncbi:DUF1129 family protein [Secundilactobacillus silagei]|uniref:Membrane protein n=1 Tax=Secundilactobacillus silagei JCM 19001 TaxID=1302250 RepID=A0A1Z5IF98_9LACO|nr:DUF1129 family protein [Secundilactobacillus silagei]TDG71581.1 hypothetical protein C5L25_002238 [Secundilactobacillus silagei JCM 19001]GAX00430.1 membrane protein [Secundilactobacillus silagei JCM 19001]
MTENEKRNAGAQQHNRNAAVHQDRNNTVKNEHAVFDNIGLTKRNADYMFRFNQALQATKLNPDKKAETVKKITAELLAGQKTGKTARNLYGNDVDAHVKEIVEGPVRPAGAMDPYWPSVLYNGLNFFTIFSIMFGIMFLISPASQKSGQTVGLISIIVSSVIAGFALPLVPRIFDSKREHRYALWIRIIGAVVFLIFWLLLFTLTSALPGYLNPALNAWVMIVLGVLGALASIWVKRQYKLTQGFFGSTPQNRRRR